MKLVINADDYGKDLPTTLAIIDAFSKGLCASATIMATGEAFEEAVELAGYNHIVDKMGIHLNLTEGRPLTDPIRGVRIFCNEEGFYNSLFRLSKPVNLKGFSRAEKTVVFLELKAQIEKCLKAGLPLSHMDSHHHVHTRWEVWQVVKPLLKEFGIPRVRLSANCKKTSFSPKTIYKYLFNKHLRWVGFETVDYFGSTDEVGDLLKRRPQLAIGKEAIEVMVHPLYQNSQELCDLNGMKLVDSVKAIGI